MAEPVLLQLLRLSLAEWPALQLAIQQGMGGSAAREKEAWMGQVIHDFLLQNKHVVDEDELYDYIADMMDHEFDTIVDDGSMTTLTRRIGYFCSLLLADKQQQLLAILDKKRAQAPLPAPEPPPTASQPTCEPMAESLEAVSRPSAEQTPAEDSDWITVCRKSNKRT